MVKIGFGPFIVDAGTRQLQRGTEILHLSPKAFQLLTRLIESRPLVVDRAVLRAHLWPDTHVVDAALGNLVAEIRHVLGADGTAVVRTIHGVGYAFAGEARDLSGTTNTEPSGSPRFWLVWNQRVIILETTDTVIGRDPGCAAWIDAPGVSRRHARIRTPPPGRDDPPQIDDLDSTNGTYVGSRALSGTASLQDGDVITLGEATLTFRAWRHIDAPTRRVKRPPT
jgi:DNA-binding winged helix-turn-helix (wHTH) protein